jgi:hypothetical protein
MRVNNNRAEERSSYHQILIYSQMGGELAVPVKVANIFSV